MVLVETRAGVGIDHSPPVCNRWGPKVEEMGPLASLTPAELLLMKVMYTQRSAGTRTLAIITEGNLYRLLHEGGSY